MVFDPFGLLARHVPEQILDRAITAIMITILLIFFFHRISDFHNYAVKILWLSESLLYPVLIIAFLFRSAPRSRARGVREIIIPLAGSTLPFALLLSPPAQAVVGKPFLFYTLLWTMTGGTILTLAGMWNLRHAFSITVEARVLVTSGPYRFVRHPIYTGEIIAAATVAMIRFSPLNLLILSLFIGIQLCRSRWEERKLSRSLPGYARFAKESRWFWQGNVSVENSRYDK